VDRGTIGGYEVGNKLEVTRLGDKMVEYQQKLDKMSNDEYLAEITRLVNKLNALTDKLRLWRESKEV